MRPHRQVAMTRKTTRADAERHEAAFEELQRVGDEKGAVDRGQRHPDQGRRASRSNASICGRSANIASEVISMTPATARP